MHKQESRPSTYQPGDCLKDPWTGPKVDPHVFQTCLDSGDMDGSLTDQITFAIILGGTNVSSSAGQLGRGTLDLN